MTIEAVPLTGGCSTEGVVRIADTVRRPLRPNAPYIHSLLKLLEEKGFDNAPRFLGIDEENREILSFIEGSVPFGKNDWTDQQLIAAAKVLRTFHDATAGSTLADGKEIVCHNDFSPWNIILRENNIVGLIDFDDAAPGSRADDFSYFLWTFLELGSDIAVEVQAPKIKMLCEAYDFRDGKKLVGALLSQQERILTMRIALSRTAADEESRNFSVERINKIQSEIKWVKANQAALENCCRELQPGFPRYNL